MIFKSNKLEVSLCKIRYSYKNCDVAILQNNTCHLDIGLLSYNVKL